MSTKRGSKRDAEPSKGRAVRPVASWAALVAATTLGLGAAAAVRAEITADAGLAAGSYRLVVQSYAEDGMAGGLVPRDDARPLGSMQREVTAAELQRGIHVTVLELGRGHVGRSVIVAWVEPGTSDLEFGAFRARPGRDAVVGIARARPRLASERAAVVLRRRA